MKERRQMSLSYGTLSSTQDWRRAADLCEKAWLYLLSALSHPSRIPATLVAVSRGAHFGEVLRLTDHRYWLKASGVRTVIDVGAHTGEFSSALRSLLPDVQIYAFEPLDDSHRKLTARFLPDRHFRAFCVALGDKDGETTFHRSSFTKASSPLRMTPAHRNAFPWTATTSTRTVPIRRLDHYEQDMTLARHVLLKLDVQGYEEHVLRGAENVLKKTTYVLVEVSFLKLYEGQPRFDEIYMLLRRHGFSYAGSWGQLLSPLDQTIMQTDALFTRTD